MANMNVRTPRFYIDYIQYLLSRGVAQNGNFDVVATGGSGATATRGLQSGTEAELFDGRPLNLCSFDTSGDVDSRILVTINMQSASPKQSFIAILNHNLKSADGKIRLFAGDQSSDVTAVNGGNSDTSDINWGSATVENVLNAENGDAASDGKSYGIKPDADGTTIIRIGETDLRYWGIQFEGTNGEIDVGSINGTWDGSTDLTVGGIMIGEIYEMPNAPDISLTRSINFDKVSMQESLGGQRYGMMTNHGRTGSSTSKSPFTTSASARHLYGGRLIYDMNFSYLSSTDVMPDEYHIKDHDDDAVVEDIWNLTNGPLLPFIFSCDKNSEGSNAQSEHIFARFTQNNLDMQQVAPDVYNVAMRIEEEF